MPLPEPIEEKTVTKNGIDSSWSERILVLRLPLATLPLLAFPLLLFLILALLLVPLPAGILLSLAIALLGASYRTLLYWPIVMWDDPPVGISNRFSRIPPRIRSRIVGMGHFMRQRSRRLVIVVLTTIVDRDGSRIQLGGNRRAIRR